MATKHLNNFASGIIDEDYSRKISFQDSNAFTELNNCTVEKYGVFEKRKGYKLNFELSSGTDYRINEYDNNSILLIYKFEGDTIFQIYAISGAGTTLPIINNTYILNLKKLRFFKTTEGILIFDGTVNDLILVKSDATLEVYPTVNLKPKYVISITVHQGSLVLLHKNDTQDKFVMSVSDPLNWRSFKAGTTDIETSFQLTFSNKFKEEFYAIQSFNSMLIIATNYNFLSVTNGDVQRIGIGKSAFSMIFTSLGSGDRSLKQLDQLLIYLATDLKTLHGKSVIRNGMAIQFLDQDFILKPQYTFKNTIFRIVQSRNSTTSELFLLSGGEVFSFQKSGTSTPEGNFLLTLVKNVTSSQFKILDFCAIGVNTHVAIINLNEKKYITSIEDSSIDYYLDLYKHKVELPISMNLSGSIVTTITDEFLPEDALHLTELASQDFFERFLITKYIDSKTVQIDRTITIPINKNLLRLRRFFIDALYINKKVQVVNTQTGAFLGTAVGDENGFCKFGGHLNKYTYGLPIESKISTGYITSQGEIGVVTKVIEIAFEDLAYGVIRMAYPIKIMNLEANWKEGLYRFNFSRSKANNQSRIVTIEDDFPFPFKVGNIDIEYNIEKF